MKRPITPSYTFTPGTGGSPGTLNLSGISGFSIASLFAVIDLKTGALIYAPLAGYGYSALSGTTLTLQASMSGLSAADPLLILYDDGGKPAEDASVQAVVTALGTLNSDLATNHSDLATLHTDVGSTLHADLAAILTKLGTRLSVSVDADTLTSLPVTIGKTAMAGDAAITAGGTAQTLFSGATPANGWKIANPDPAEDLWVSDSTTAAPNGQGSTRVPAGGIVTTEPGEKPCGPVSVYGATTGHFITARAW
ncbi:hypothetical protein [Lichenifustis flavocetrariae]|uniref:Uncharacterized protein n=1 Tax=Lichenifustis flavocetrariae TaxID=2949735 RepID=A0AA42CQ18_9HYPH|nr:hypothetical protein [Lichenifustis flavocetrariae]MCW6510997.1 hypothetical protein [Lichenifustis flavocetrariae]